jgi:hypothetical protein
MGKNEEAGQGGGMLTEATTTQRYGAGVVFCHSGATQEATFGGFVKPTQVSNTE